MPFIFDMKQNCVLEVMPFHPDIQDTTYVPLPSPTTPVKERSFHFETPYPGNITVPHGRSARAPCMELSPTGRSTVPQGEHAGLMNWMSRTGEGLLPSPRNDLSQYPDSRPSNQNAVDIERIRLGLDVRTTVCETFEISLCMGCRLIDFVNIRSCYAIYQTRSIK